MPGLVQIPERRKFLHPGPVVKVHVRQEGGETKTFPIHRKKICASSRYFKVAFKSPFMEGENQELWFGDVDVHIFGVFVSWLYTKKISIDVRKLDACGILIDLWLLGDRIIAPKLQNEALRNLDEARVIRGALPRTHYKQIYENTAEHSALRKYVQLVWNNVVLCKENTEEVFPHQLLLEIVHAEEKRRAHPDYKRCRLPQYCLGMFFLDERVGSVRKVERARIERPSTPEPVIYEPRTPESDIGFQIPRFFADKYGHELDDDRTGILALLGPDI